MSQTWDDIDAGAGGDTPATAWPKANDKFASLQSNFSGTVNPSPYVAGKAFFDITDPASPHLKHYIDGSYGTLLVHHDNKGGDVDWHEAEMTNMRLECRATTDASAASTAGRIWYNEVTGFAELDDFSVSGTVKKIHAGNVNFYEKLTIETGASAPSITTAGSTPGVKGYVIDDTSKSLLVKGVIPYGWEANSDMYCYAICALPSSETANDDIELTVDYVVITPDNNEALTKSSAQATTSFDIGLNTAQWSVHKVPVTIDYDLAGNLCCHGDQFMAEISLTTTTDLTGGIMVLDAYLVGTRNR